MPPLDTTNTPPDPLSHRPWLHLAGVLAFVLAVAVLAHRLLDWAMQVLRGAEGDGMLALAVIAAVLVVYAMLIAIPFVPGVEIGVAVLLLGGASVAPLVYLATITGLLAAFAIGRFLSVRTLHAWACRAGVTRLATLLDGIATRRPEARLVLLRRHLPPILSQLLVDWRYLSLAALINLPGNSLLGGGGGLLLAAGVTGVFRPVPVILTVGLAVLPIPLVVWLLGPGILS